MVLLFLSYIIASALYFCDGQNSIPGSSGEEGSQPFLMPGAMCLKVGPVRTPVSDEDPCQKCSCSYGFVLCKKQDDCQSGNSATNTPTGPGDQRMPKINQQANQLPISPPVVTIAPPPTRQPECFGEGVLPPRDDKKCLDCVCINETVHCKPTPCPALPPKSAGCNEIKKSGSCCSEFVCRSNPDRTPRINSTIPVHPECIGEGALPPRADKRCLFCVCISGIVQCTNQSCPKLDIPGPGCTIITPPGACCPEIQCVTTTLPPPPVTLECEEGDEFSPPPGKQCFTCVCIGGIVECEPISCPHLQRPNRGCQIIKLPGQCCPQITCRNRTFDPIFSSATSHMTSITTHKPFPISHKISSFSTHTSPASSEESHDQTLSTPFIPKHPSFNSQFTSRIPQTNRQIPVIQNSQEGAVTSDVEAMPIFVDQPSTIRPMISKFPIMPDTERQIPPSISQQLNISTNQVLPSRPTSFAIPQTKPPKIMENTRQQLSPSNKQPNLVDQPATFHQMNSEPPARPDLQKPNPPSTTSKLKFTLEPVITSRLIQLTEPSEIKEDTQLLQTNRQPNLVNQQSTLQQKVSESPIRPDTQRPNPPTPLILKFTTEPLMSSRPTSRPIPVRPSEPPEIMEDDRPIKPPQKPNVNKAQFPTSLSTSQHSSSSPSDPTCEENEQMNFNGPDPCKMCRCINGQVKCTQNPCPLIQPLSGCVLERKLNECCPTITCEAGEMKHHFTSDCTKHLHAIPEPNIYRPPPGYPRSNPGGPIFMYEFQDNNQNMDRRPYISRWKTRYSLPYRDSKSSKSS